MNDQERNELRFDYERLTGPVVPKAPGGKATRYKTCPECLEELPVWTVKKDNQNHGRPFTVCKPCGYFHWEDLPKCKGCGEDVISAKVKRDTPNKGRKFQTCPNSCFFRWLS